MSNRYKVKITGKNVLRFIKKLINHKIKIYNLNMISNNEAYIIIDTSCLEEISKIKTIYELEVVETYGLNKKVKLLKNNFLFLILVLINTIFTIFLANYILEVEVIETEPEMRAYIENVLKEKKIAKYQRKLSYEEVNKLKNEILNDHKDRIEWLEIVPNGTKYLVMVEKRILNEKKGDDVPSNIVAKKNGIVKTIVAEKGQILVEKNQYVKVGDILISGDIKINEVTKNKIKAIGKVYAETWYKATSEQSFHLKVDEPTNRQIKGLNLKFFNKNFKLYKGLNDVLNEKVIVKADILPLSLLFTNEQEKIKKDVILTYEEALNLAFEKAKNKISENLNDEEKIISAKQLKVMVKDSKIIVDIFFNVYEEISLIERIE